MLVLSRSQLNVSNMADAQQSVNFALLSQDNINSTDAVLSITAVKGAFWRAVLTVKGEKTRLWHQTSISSGVSPKTPQQLSTPHFGCREKKTGVGDPTG